MARHIVAGANAGTNSPDRASPNGLPGIEKSQSVWFDCYRGSADSLVAAGIVSAAQIPGTPGTGKTMMTFYRGERSTGGRRSKDEHYLQISRYTRGLFEVRVGITAEESARRMEVLRAEQARQRRQEAARRERKKAAEDLSFRSNAESLRRQCLLALSMLEGYIVSHSPGLCTGKPYFLAQFATSSDETDNVVDLIATLEAWLKAAPITTVSGQEQQLHAARFDKAFQAFMEAQCLGDRP